MQQIYNVHFLTDAHESLRYFTYEEQQYDIKMKCFVPEMAYCKLSVSLYHNSVPVQHVQAITCQDRHKPANGTQCPTITTES